MKSTDTVKFLVNIAEYTHKTPGLINATEEKHFCRKATSTKLILTSLSKYCLFEILQKK